MMDFKLPYNKEHFINFLRSFLPEDTKFSSDIYLVDETFKKFNSVKSLGQCKSLNDIKIIEIEHNVTEDSRVTLTREIFRFLSKHIIRNALIITFNKNEGLYRFSLIVSTIEWKNETSTKKFFSNPRRLSFLLGPNAKIHTPNNQLKTLGQIKNFEDLKERFNIEIVSEEFYDKYKTLFFKLEKYFTEDDKFNKFAKKNKINKSLLSKKLLGQITFSYFIQKKGWLGAKKNEEFFKGSKNFLREKFELVDKCKKNYFNDFLEYLFYDGFNNEEYISDFYNKHLECKVPFLNGGLFEPINNYDWKVEAINIPNTMFSNENGDGILDVFDLFNFTVDENQTLDTDLAIDPEMLGKVYERLIDEALKKKYRPFYTHREVVNYMCTISLIKFLLNKFGDKLNFEEIEQIFKDSNQFLLDGYIEKDRLFKNKYSNYLKKINQELSDILICDPAIGSGAFPVAMMNLVTNVRVFISQLINVNISRHKIKYNFIKNSIHGVDIDESAVEIAKLRMWLSLVIDENNMTKTTALPNLRYRIVQGDSLVESYANFYFKYDYSDTKQGELLQDYSSIELEFKKLISEQNEFYKAIYSTKKNKLKKQIISRIENIVFSVIDNSGEKEVQKNLLKNKFSKSLENNNFHNFFPWRLIFANVFSLKQGFDIIIGNPPYTEARSKDFSEDKKNLYLKEIKNKWGSDCKITRGSDLMVYFFPLCLELLNKDGVNTLITSNSWLSTNYGQKLQNFLIEKFHVQEIVDSDFRYFPKGKGKGKSPDVNTVISIISLKNDKQKHESLELKFIKIKERFNNLDSFKLQNKKDISLKKFNLDDKKLKNFKWGLLFDTEDWLLKIFSNLIQEKTDINYYIGQGLNLKKEQIINKDSLKNLKIPKDKLIPFSSKEALYCTNNSNNFLIDKDKCDKNLLKILKINKIIPFDKNLTRKEPPKLFLPRGIADKHFCSLNINDSFTDSAVDIYFNKEFKDFEQRRLNFWVFLNSSLLSLFRETSGRKSLGGGLLKSEATDLSLLNLYYDFGNNEKIKKLYFKMAEREVQNIEFTLKDSLYLELDNIVMKYFKIEKYADKIRELLITKSKLRASKAKT